MKKFRALLPALAFAFAVTLGACGDANPVAPPSQAVAVTGNGNLLGLPLNLGNLDLLKCTPLAYDTESKTIGTAGGEIRVGPHVFTVPAGALTKNVKITATIVPGSANRVHFEPEGLTFAKPATLDMSYSNCYGLGLLLPKRVVYVGNNAHPNLVLEIVSTLDNLLMRRIKGKVAHFSDYAIASDEAFSDYSVGW